MWIARSASLLSVDAWYTINMEYQHDAHRVHLVAYHIVFCPKRRKAVLVGDVARDCDVLLREVAVANGWSIVALEIMPDHVHVFIRTDPTVGVHEVVRLLKGRTSHDLREQYPELRKLPSLWTRSYFVATTGNVSQHTIRRYIEDQKGR